MQLIIGQVLWNYNQFSLTTEYLLARLCVSQRPHAEFHRRPQSTQSSVENSYFSQGKKIRLFYMENS